MREFDYTLDVYASGGRVAARIQKDGSVVAAGIGDDETRAILNAAMQLAGHPGDARSEPEWPFTENPHEVVARLEARGIHSTTTEVETVLRNLGDPSMLANWRPDLIDAIREVRGRDSVGWSR